MSPQGQYLICLLSLHHSQQLSKTTGALIPEVSTSGRKTHLVTNHHGWSSIPGGSSVLACVRSPSFPFSSFPDFLLLKIRLSSESQVHFLQLYGRATYWTLTVSINLSYLPQTSLTSNYTVWVPQLTLSNPHLIFRSSFPIDMLLLKNISPPNFIPYLPSIF